MVGADTRCASNNSSSLFAFLKVTQPTDTFGFPSFIVSLKTHGGDSIEPIDSLQTLFDAVRSCTFSTVGIKTEPHPFAGYQVYPNPASDNLTLKTTYPSSVNCVIYNLMGSAIKELDFSTQAQINTSNWPRGVYFVRFSSGGTVKNRKIVLVE